MASSDEKKWADVVFPHPPLQRFTYEIPDALQKDLKPGHRVIVPLGNRKMAGFVVDFVPKPDVHPLRLIEDILDPAPLLTPDLLKLTQWIADYYLTTWGDVLRAALPPGIHRKTRLIIHAIEKSLQRKTNLTDLQKKIIGLVRDKGKISLQSLQRLSGEKNIRHAVNALEKVGLIRAEHVLEDARVQAQAEVWVSLKSSVDEREIQLLKKRAPKQAYCLSLLQKYGDDARRSDLDVDFAVLKRLKEKGWIDIWEEEIFRDPYAATEILPAEPVELTRDQQKALATITAVENTFRVCLLHGVTGSGKTQVYIKAIRRVMEMGKTALVLIPEISLTPQAVQRYRAVFGDDVAVLHSRLSAGERVDSWRQIHEGACRIALGPRSTVFAPLENLGLIIVDEEHENSYKQIDPAPRYHARDVAVVRGKMNACPVILGSATPSLESYTNAVQGKYVLCELPQRIDETPMPQVQVVEMNDRESGGKKAIFSPVLQGRMEACLDKREQIILLQNRRGYAHFLLCTACGEIEECPHCDISMTYHQKGRHLQCHYCGYKKPASDACQKCGGATLACRGVGTQRVEEELKKIFPDHRIHRMDQDTTRRKGSHDRIVSEFGEGDGSILLGTQMVAKGHDFSRVSLVGVISADTGLFFPDFRSGERTFQLLTQAAGRSGRRDTQGDVIVQTRSPEHPAIRFAREHDFKGFYAWESEQRRELKYPPWGRLILLRFRGPKQETVAKAAESFPKHLPKDDAYQLLGPVPAPLPRVKGHYRYHLILKGDKDRDATGRRLRQIARRALIRFHEKTHHPGVRVVIDVDPVDTL